MRYGPGHKEEARGKILSAAGRGFRRLGYGGIGVDGLAKEAGVTSGAFYGHFPSKADAFRAAALSGLSELREAIEHLRATEGDAWLATFAEFYMTVRRTCDLGESCALQSISPEVARADAETKAAYGDEMAKVVQAVADGLNHRSAGERHKAALTILAMLSGGVTLARSVADPEFGASMAEAIKAAALAAAQPA